MPNQKFVYGTAQNLNSNVYTKEGYTFAGWNTSPDGSGTSYIDGQEVNKLTAEDNGVVNLYAQWTVNEYDIVFKKNELPDEYQKVEYIESSGTQYIMTNIIPSDTNGMYAKVASMNTSSDVIFVGSKGSSNSRFWLGNTGGGFYFGWNMYTTNRPAITRDSINIIKLNYLNDRKKVYNDNILESNIETLSSDNKSPISIFAANVNGSISYRSSIKLYELKVSKDSNVIANFIPCYRKNDNVIGLYDIINGVFYENNGTGSFNKGIDINDNVDGTMANQHFVYGTAQNLNANVYIKPGYRFAGWNTSPDGSGTSFTDGQNVNKLTTENNGIVNLYAQWEGNEYSVEFNANGGTGTMADQSFIYGVDQNLSANIFTKVNYTFAGWNTESDGTGTSYADGQTVNSLTTENNGKVTLYAQWTGQEYKVRLNPNGGSVSPSSITVTYAGTYGTLPVPTRTDLGYTFVGWYTDQTGGDKIESSTIVTVAANNQTLWAHWTPNKYKVTLDNQNATTAGTTDVWYYYNTTQIVNNMTVYYYADEACTTPLTYGYNITIPTKEGYTFRGYYTGIDGTGTQYVDANGKFVNNIYATFTNDTTLYAYWTAN